MNNVTLNYDNTKTVNILYRNWKGETAVRKIVPIELQFESNEWHPQKQWILYAYDLDKNDKRAFACLNILAWYIN